MASSNRYGCYKTNVCRAKLNVNEDGSYTVRGEHACKPEDHLNLYKKAQDALTSGKPK